ncbi:MAG: hypothetical protein ACFCUV_13305 [Rivularia sp. (in: cyanobacteria)]
MKFLSDTFQVYVAESMGNASSALHLRENALNNKHLQLLYLSS